MGSAHVCAYTPRHRPPPLWPRLQSWQSCGALRARFKSLSLVSSKSCRVGTTFERRAIRSTFDPIYNAMQLCTAV